MSKIKVSVLSLGCSKNLVDSERLARRFADMSVDVAFVDELPQDGSILVVNTCGFIGDAKEESVNILLGACELKKEGRLAAVYGMGCLTERYREELLSEIPELDGIRGKFDWDGLVTEIAGRDSDTRPWSRTLSTLPHYAYVKISEGCNRFCAFCAIPLITGRHHSRPAAEILEEVRELAAGGTREFNIIAQDLSSYGRDLSADGSSQLASLLEDMAHIDGVEMIRLHYAYPSDFPYDILPVMARNRQICKYLDIALQHIDDRVLDNMQRHITAAQTRELLDRIRREVPGIHIRTTMMVGFPGEDDAAFERLIDFVKEQRFERLGAFAYCEEEGTYAARHLGDPIPEEVKQARLDRLMTVQEEIASEIAEEKVGQILRVIIDKKLEDGVYEGRTEFDSPEVDPVVIVNSDRELVTGDIYDVRILGGSYVDLEGVVADAPFLYYRLPNDTEWHRCGFTGMSDDKKRLRFGDAVIEPWTDCDFGTMMNVCPESVSEKEYAEAVGPLISKLQKRGGKAVFCRQICGSMTDLNLDELKTAAESYFSEFGDAFCFIFYHPVTGWWMGSTPELLLEVESDNEAKTRALAGTRFCGPDRSEEWDEKNLAEHHMVIDDICGNISALSAGLEVTPCGMRSLVYSHQDYGALEHLCTDIRIVSHDGSLPVEEILDAIHPTAAVCGYPRAEALDEIRNSEYWPRHCYGGRITVQTPAGSVSYAILRCVHFRNNGWAVYAGSGITADSTVDEEYRETALKAAPLTSLFERHFK